MKVLFIAGADQQYGTYYMSKQLLETSQSIEKNTKFVVVTQKHGALNKWCDEKSIENYVLPYRYCVYHPVDNSIKNVIKLYIKKAIVQSFNRLALYRLSRLRIMNSIDIIHSNINRDLFGVMISRKYRLPHIMHLREFSRAHFMLEPLFDNQTELMDKYTQCFIAISEAVKRDWEDYGLTGEKIRVIYDGIDVRKYKFVSQKDKEAGPLKVVICGAIYEGKGQRELVRAVTELIHEGKDITLDIYGDAASENYYREILRYIETNNVGSRIHFMGYNDKLNEILCNYDVGAVCSKAEGFGIVTVEYMLSGLTVIATNSGANPELLKPLSHSLLYPYGDMTKLKEILVKAIEIKDIYNDEKEIAAEYAKSYFCSEKSTRCLLDTYKTLTGAKL